MILGGGGGGGIELSAAESLYYYGGVQTHRVVNFSYIDLLYPLICEHVLD